MPWKSYSPMIALFVLLGSVLGVHLYGQLSSGSTYRAFLEQEEVLRQGCLNQKVDLSNDAGSENIVYALAGCTIVIHNQRANSEDVAHAYLLRGLARYRSNTNVVGALADLTQGINLKPQALWRFYQLRGAIALAANREGLCTENVLADLSEAVRLNPSGSGAAAARVSRSFCYAWRRAYAQAVEDLEFAILLDPSSEELYYRQRQAQYWNDAGMPAKAREVWQKYAAVARSVQVYERYMYQLKSDDVEVLQMGVALCTKVMDEFPDQKAQWLYYRAEFYQRLNDSDKARADFETVVALGASVRSKFKQNNEIPMTAAGGQLNMFAAMAEDALQRLTLR